MVSTKFANSPIVPSKWFPNANLCGGSDDIWQQYADFHAAVISGKQKGKFLIFDCTKKECAGYGNRVQSITSLLIVAMLTNHVFLIDAPKPVHLDYYLLPNAIQWNSTVPRGAKYYFVDLFHSVKNFQSLENAVFYPIEQDIVRVQTYYGTVYLYELMSEQFANKMLSIFKLETLYDLVLLFGCTFDYLFKYDPRVHDVIESMQREYNLETGKFVALHVRSHIHDAGQHPFNPLNLTFPFKPMFECAVMAAKALHHKLNVTKVPIFLTTDDQVVTDFAKKNYPGMILSNAPFFHIDRTKYNGLNAHQQYDDGMIGIFSDIEISSRAAVLIRSASSSFSEQMGVLHYMPPKYNLHPFYFYENLTLCQLTDL